MPRLYNGEEPNASRRGLHKRSFPFHVEHGKASPQPISPTPESQGSHRRAGVSARGGTLGEAADVSPGVLRTLMEKETHP